MPWNIVGHERPVSVLVEALAAARLPQSLLLTGPRQVGKRTLALALAAAINCPSPGAPCGSCRACRLSGSGGYPDVHLVQLREGRQKIGIQEIQELQGELARRPSEGRRRLALIASAERLSAEAENCLLKTLEEPPPYAVIVLTTEEAESLLPTTVSRCQRVRLRPVPLSLVEQHLARTYGLPPAEARLLAALSEGRPGWAIAAAENRARLDVHEAALARLKRVVEGSKLTRLEVARELAESWSGKSEQVRDELRVWSRWWRDLLLVKIGLEQRVAHLDRLEELRWLAERHPLDELTAALATLVQVRADLDQNVNPRLALDVGLLRLPARSRVA